jgi:hypothetical protein
MQRCGDWAHGIDRLSMGAWLQHAVLLKNTPDVLRKRRRAGLRKVRVFEDLVQAGSCRSARGKGVDAARRCIRRHLQRRVQRFGEVAAKVCVFGAALQQREADRGPRCRRVGGQGLRLG